MKAVASHQAEIKRASREGVRTLLHNYLGKAAEILPGPQAFIVDKPDPGARTDPHFHDVDQFQVFVGGAGTFGKEAVAPIWFHYADAYTPYGPILGADIGIQYFTLRLAATGGYFPMPGSRHLMPGPAGRNRAGRLEFDGAPPAAGKTARRVLLGDEPDGLLVLGLRMAPDTSLEGEPSTGGGQYYLVCAGALLEGGRSLVPRSLLFVEAGENTLLRAGPAGCELLLLQFPRATSRPGSDPAKLAGRESADYVMPPRTSFASSS